MKHENKPIRWNVFIPYAMYALSGVLIAYMYFNRKKQLFVAASLTPIFGGKVTQGIWVVLADVLSVLAIALGLASSLGAGLALIGSGLYSAYGVAQGPIVWIALTAIIAYGRTVRQFLIVNWILPASFGFVWFSVWGSTALEWQKSGKADIITAIQSGGAQGVDGVKYLAACGGFVVLIVFIFQVAAAFKVFFFDPETKKDIVDSVDQIES